ncbi:MAG: hypothetical protein HYT39_02920 [Candidatus Sungbacteria bacterium]|nr:hypothetical protein [Candidatus Sungbacteria bacterium]
MSPVSTPGSGSSIKYVWVVVAVIVLLAIAYFWYSGTFSLYQPNETATEETAPAADDVTSIEADLGTTDLDNLGADLNSLETELNQ